MSFLHIATDTSRKEEGRHVFVFQAPSGAQGGVLGDSEAGINNEVDHTAGATLKPFLLKACLNSTAGTIC